MLFEPDSEPCQGIAGSWASHTYSGAHSAEQAGRALAIWEALTVIETHFFNAMLFWGHGNGLANGSGTQIDEDHCPAQPNCQTAAQTAHRPGQKLRVAGTSCTTTADCMPLQGSTCARLL